MRLDSRFHTCTCATNTYTHTRTRTGINILLIYWHCLSDANLPPIMDRRLSTNHSLFDKFSQSRVGFLCQIRPFIFSTSGFILLQIFLFWLAVRVQRGRGFMWHQMQVPNGSLSGNGLCWGIAENVFSDDFVLTCSSRQIICKVRHIHLGYMMLLDYFTPE